MLRRLRFLAAAGFVLGVTTVSYAAADLGYIKWPPVTLKPQDLNLLPVGSLAQLIDHIRKQENVPVLIFKSLPEKEAANPELLAIPNSEMEQAAVDQMIRGKADIYTLLEGRAVAQYLPPYLKNGLKGDLRDRPYPSRALLTLGRAAGRISALHEFLHHRYQSAVYPAPVQVDGKPVHPYNYQTDQLDEQNRKFERIEAEFQTLQSTKNVPLEKLEARMLERMQSYLKALHAWTRHEREPQIEEIRVWFATFVLAKHRKFSFEERREALHKLWAQMTDWHDFLDTNIRSSEMLRICAKQNRAFLKQEDLQYVTWFENLIKEDLKNLSDGYAMIARDLLELKLDVDLKKLADQRRAKITVKEGRLNIAIPEETELFLTPNRQ